VKRVRRETPVPERRSAEAKNLSPVAALVRRHDRDRFQTVLFAPAECREALFALYAFNYEIARVRDSVIHPALGQIRLEWWRENIASAFGSGAVRRHPVVEALTGAIRDRALTRRHFDRLIDARERDLDDEPPPTLEDLEHYAEETSASLVYLALEILGASASPSREAGYHVGIGYGLAGLLRSMPHWVRNGRGFIPKDVAERNGIPGQDWVSLRGTAGLSAATRELAAAACRQLASARAASGKLPRSAFPALLPAKVAQRWLVRLKRADYDAFEPTLAALDTLQVWRLALAALRNRL
jgi:phytoene synthase